MSNWNNASKTTSLPRIDTLDRIRGFALLGILIMNIQTYTLLFFLRPAQVYEFHLDSQDTYVFWLFPVYLFFKGQFYTIYSFLFGLGFYLMWNKNVANGLQAQKMFSRRLCILLLLGLIHGSVFWFGDVLHNYALLGFTLPYFAKKSVSEILKWIVLLSGFMIVFIVLNTFFLIPETSGKGSSEIDKITRKIVETWQGGSVLEVAALQGKVLLFRWKLLASSGFEYLFHYEIMFLLGIIAGKLNLFRRVQEFKPRLFKPALLLLPVALAVKGVSQLGILKIQLLPEKYDRLLHDLADLTGTTFLTLIYLTLLTFVFQNRSLSVFRWIGNAGRLGLTNYLGQTLICMILFYGYAGALSGKLTLRESLAVALCIYSFQVLCSNLWLRHFKTGPMEWLLRRLTYGKERTD